jgi:uncharacterized Zn finger protein
MKCPNCGDESVKYDKVLHGELKFRQECPKCKTIYEVKA